MTGSAASVVVIGGGAVGMSIALHLKWGGARVQLVEAGTLGGGCSQLGGGWVAAQGRRNQSQLAFALDSIGYYPELLARIGTDAGFRRAGSFLLLETEEQVSQRRTFLADQMRLPGYDGFEFLDLKQLGEIEPAIRSPRIIAGTYRAKDCAIDPPALCDGLASAIRAEGIAVAEGARVEGLVRSGSGWTVRSTVGDFVADAVVIAAGPQVAPLAGMAGLDLPLNLISGQIMTTEPQAPYVKALVVVMHNHAIPDCPARDLRQGADGRLWIGTVNHHGSGDAKVRRGDTDIIRREMSALFPELADIPFTHGYAGTRPLAEDGLPCYGAAGDGLFIAAPMSGIAEAAAAGRTMAELVITGTSAALPQAFSPLRLVPGAARGTGQ
ncbi:NAD(P)/FAD-dependent oxidoreductase [Devosia enhydra]|nr:FAD-dependent oxidoreductase [Devosia enhydra]